VDPIRPFATLLRALRAGRKTSVADARESERASTNELDVGALVASAATQSLEQALRSQLPDTGQWDRRRAREIFVEHALLRELGRELSSDSAFAELVANVSELIAQRPAICERLDVLLKSIAVSR
jgi:hypothetical protein